MGRRRVDHDRTTANLKTTTVTLDVGVLPFIMAMSDDGKVSSGVRACIRAAIFHQTKQGRLPSRYLAWMLVNQRLAAETYLAQYPEQAPEGFQRCAYTEPDAFAGWDDPE